MGTGAGTELPLGREFRLTGAMHLRDRTGRRCRRGWESFLGERAAVLVQSRCMSRLACWTLRLSAVRAVVRPWWDGAMPLRRRHGCVQR